MGRSDESEVVADRSIISLRQRSPEPRSDLSSDQRYRVVPSIDLFREVREGDSVVPGPPHRARTERENRIQAILKQGQRGSADPALEVIGVGLLPVHRSGGDVG